MDYSTLTQYFVLVVLLGCLVIGYIIKHATLCKKIPNNDIPVILAVIGALSNLFVSGLSFESFVYGAVMGLASTGMYEGFRNFVEGRKTNISEED